MRVLHSRRAWLAAIVPLALALASAPVGHAEPDPTELVKQLGHDEYERRERAAAELKALGEKAIPAVRDGTASPDAEIRTRTQALLFTLMLAAGKSPSTKMQLRPIRGRAFVMGSPKTEANRRPDEDAHPVRITKMFLIGTHEVTQGEYELVMKRNPSWFSKTGGDKAKAPADTSRYPVEQVTWFDALEFCNRLSKLDGHPPHYKLSNEVTTDGSITAAAVEVLGGAGYRLPTEAEWEYACRGGTDSRFHYGRVTTGGRSLNAKVFIASSGYGSSTETFFPNRTTAVGAYPRNPFGLFDMHGNVGEWCWDWYERDYYATSSEADPPGPKGGTHRVLRGGSWLIADTSCRSASRGFHAPGEATYFTGFRVARSP